MTHSVLHSFTQSVTLYALWNAHETHFVAYSVTNFMKHFVMHSLTFSVTTLTFKQTVFWPLFFAANIKNDAIKKRLKKRLILFPNFTKKWHNPWLIPWNTPWRNSWSLTHSDTHFVTHSVTHLVTHSVTHSVCRVFMKTQFWFITRI